MKRIAFGIVTVTALAWGVSVQAAPNGAAASLKGAERQASTQLIQHRHHRHCRRVCHWRGGHRHCHRVCGRGHG
jgi:hypothetical protein